MADRIISGHVLEEAALIYIVAMSPASANVQAGIRSIPSQAYMDSPADSMIEFPDKFGSSATVRWLGLSPRAAQSVYDNWFEASVSANTPFGRSPVIAGVTAHINARKHRQNCTAFLLEHDWLTALRNLGCSDDLADRILAPEFTDIRLQKSAADWLLETVIDRWECLKAMSARIQRRGRARQLDFLAPSSTSGSSSSEQTLISDNGQGSKTNNGPAARARTVSPQQDLSGRTILFKGGYLERLEQACSTNNDGLDLLKLRSPAPTDFHPSSPFLLYFTKQKQVARRYAEWAHQRSPDLAVTIMCMAAPSHVFDRVYSLAGEEWAEMVWYSSSVRAAAELPHNRPFPYSLMHTEQEPVLYGGISGSSREAAEDKSEIKCWEVEVDGNMTTAVQYRFAGPQIRHTLEQECKGMVWFEEP